MKRLYFTNSDYDMDVLTSQLQELSGSNTGDIQIDPRIIQRTEKIVLEDIKSYLIQRYDLDEEFTETGTFSISKQYNVADRIIIDYDSFLSSQSYNFGDCVINNGSGYICSTSSIGATTSFDLSNWTYLGNQYDMYYTKYPAPLFSDLNYYNAGDVVFWHGITYSCVFPTTDLTYTQAMQYLYTQNLPNLNVIPDDKNLNSNYAYWMPGSTMSYTIPVGTLPTDTTYWINDDNRCYQILNVALDMVIFYLHRRISPRNIPDHRKTAYDRACQFLDDVANGEYNITALYKVPQQGTGFRAGSNSYDDNNW